MVPGTAGEQERDERLILVLAHGLSKASILAIVSTHACSAEIVVREGRKVTILLDGGIPMC